MFRKKKIEIKLVDDTVMNMPIIPTIPAPSDATVEAAKQALVGGALLFLTKIIIDAGTEIAIATITTK